MRERPILMSGPLVRAVLDGRKTQTRRLIQSPAKNMQHAGMQVIKRREPGDPWYGDAVWSMRNGMGVWGDYTHDEFLAKCPHGQVGDRLWVRETWQAWSRTGVEYDEWEICEGAPSAMHERYGPPHIDYQANFVRRCGAWERDDRPGYATHPDRWRPSLHMPRWASRLSLVITDVRVERLQDISEEDAREEGCFPPPAGTDDDGCHYDAGTFRCGFRAAWQGIYGVDAWDRNPWVWAISFKREVTP